MNPQNDPVSNFGMAPSNNDVGPLPPVQPPEAFHAPQTTMPHFNAPAANSPQTALPQIPSAPQMSAIPIGQPQQSVAQPVVVAVPEEEPDTPLDEEWVEKAKLIVSHTHADPFMQSKELGQLKAGYIKARYNKDVKAEE